MKLALLIVTIFVGSCIAQVAKPVDDLTLVTLRPPPPPPPPCGVFPIDVTAFTARLGAGDIPDDDGAADAEEKRSAVLAPWHRCEDGPRKVRHNVPGEFHWPRITRLSCDNLYCRDPSCLVRKSEWVSKCVHVFKWVYGRWVYKGRQLRKYKNHLECSCRNCRDIYSFSQCVNTRPCPNGYDRDSFCYWRFGPIFTIGPPTLISPLAKAAPVVDAIAAPVPFPLHGNCQCCTPVPCEPPKVFKKSVCRCVCPSPPPRCKPPQIYNPKTCLCECPPPNCGKGQTYNTETCQCECPKGSVLDENNVCVGDCKDVRLDSCSFVRCEDNPHFHCKSIGYKCTCPTCDSANAHQCTRTKCLDQDQPLKPKCKYDHYTQKCRCPKCQDQNDKPWCAMTHCINSAGNRQLCRWDGWSCSCPRH